MKKYISPVFQVIALSTFLIMGGSECAFAQSWYGTAGWLYRKAITIDYTKVPNTDQASFPVLVSLTSDAGLSAHALSTGFDILFTAGNGTTKLNYNREFYTNGTLVAWVQIPALSHTANTVIYMYYGNPGATDQQAATSTWNASFQGVWHLNEASASSNAVESTSNNYTGTQTNSPGTVTGQMAGARSFNGTNQYFQLAGKPPFNQASAITYDFWVKMTSVGGYTAGVNVNGGHGSGGTFLTMGSVAFWWTPSGPNSDRYFSSNVSFSTNTWYHVVETMDYTNKAFHCYINGGEVTSTLNTAITGSWVPATSYDQSASQIGGRYVNTQNYFNGSLDEFRIYNSIRSVDWVKTEYNNQGSPSTFYSLGPELNCTATSAIWVGTTSTNWNTGTNWCNGSVPTSAVDVTIPSDPANQPVITGAMSCNNITINSGASLTISSSGSNSLSVSGNWTNNGGTFTPNTSPVIFSGTGKTIGGTSSTTFYDVSLTGSASVTTGIATTIGHNLSIGNGTTFTAAGYNLTVTGTTTIGTGTSGNLIISSPAGAKLFTGLVTISNGGTWNNSGNSAIEFRGGITNNATGTFTAGSGVQSFTTNSQALTGTFSIPGVTVTGITLTNGNTLTVATALEGSGGLTQATGATLNIGGTSGITGLTATNSGNTVNYTAGGQTIAAVTYYNCYTSAAGNYTAGGTITIANAGLFDNGGGGNNAAVLDMGSYTFVKIGTATIGNNGATIKFGGVSNGISGWTSGTIEYNGSVNQTIAGGDYSDLRLNNSSGATLGGDVTVNNTFTFTSGKIITTGSYTLTIGASGTITGNDASKYVDGKLARVFSGTGSKDFPVGKAGYHPMTFNYTAVTGISTVTAEEFESVMPGTPPANTVMSGPRYYTITGSGGSGYTYFVTLDGSGWSPTHTVKMIKGDGSTNTAYNVTTPDYTNAAGFNTFSNFGLGESAISNTTTPDDKAVCYGSTSVNLTAIVYPNPGGGTVQFYIDGNTAGSPESVNAGTGIATLAYNPGALSSGNHPIRADFSGYGDYPASSSDPGSNGNLTVNPLPTASATKTDISCFNANNGQIIVTGSDGTPPYYYSIYNGSGGYQSGDTFTGLAPGQYKIRVTDGNGCESPAIP